MRPGVCWLACTVLALCASPVGAQPLFHCEHDWTIEIGGGRYGFRDVVQTPGEFRWTQVWVAGRPFEPLHQPADRWMLAVPAVAPVLAVRYLTAPWGSAAGRRGAQ